MENVTGENQIENYVYRFALEELEQALKSYLICQESDEDLEECVNSIFDYLNRFKADWRVSAKYQKELMNMSETGEISMNTDEFYTLVRSMREAQRLYFKTRSRDVLIESKRLEAVVDKEIQRYFEQQTAEEWDKRNVDDNAKAERRKAFVGALHSALKAFVEHIDALEELKSCITIMEEFMEAYQYERD